MKIEAHSSYLSTFAVYTLFGYLSLALHHILFFPNRGNQPSDFGMVLMFVNLVAGGYCFWRAILESRAWWRSLQDESD